MLLFFTLFVLSFSRGVQIGFYKDSLCLFPANIDIDYLSMSWTLLDVCVPDLRDPSLPGSSMYTLEKSPTNSTWKYSHHLWDRASNCTGFSWIDGSIEFSEYDKCIKNYGQHIKVSMMDKPGDKPKGTVAISKYPFESSQPKCIGDIVEVDYYYMDICLNIGDILHPLHSFKKCKKKESQYVVELWHKQISECLYKPDDHQIFNLGKCYNGFTYDC